MRFEGKVALVTGGARGQGAAIVEQFLIEGASVVYTDIDSDAGLKRQDTLREQHGSDRVRFLRQDVSALDSWLEVVDFVKLHWPRLDVLVNNAGRTGGRGLFEGDATEWNAILSTNLTSVWASLRAVAPLLEQSGHGAVVNTASIFGFLAAPVSIAYQVSKAGVVMLTRAAALELAPLNIRVNCVVPGVIDTAMLAGVPADLLATRTKRAPMGRMGTPEEVARAVLFLASEDAAFVTGISLFIDGGYSIN